MSNEAELSSQFPDRDWDPLDPEAFRDAHATYADLRRRCPVAFTDRWGGFWTLTRYRDIVRVAGDARTFISSIQNLVPKSPRNGLSRKPLASDPPEHGYFRRVLNRHFASERLTRLESAFRAQVVRFLEPLIARGEGDAVSELAAHLPLRAICLWLDVPENDAEWIQQRSGRYVEALAMNDSTTASALSAELDDYARSLVATRKTQGYAADHDAVSGLLATRIKGNQLPDEWIAGCIRMVIVAGDRSTTNGIAGCIEQVGRNRELQQQLRNESALIPAAVEEALRLISPSQVLVRTTTRAVNIGGQQIEEGAAIAMLFSAGNRDPEVFPDPDTFVLGRNPNRHLAFGHGIHKCAAASLARLELRVVLEEMLARTGNWEICGPVTYNRWPEYGPATLPIRLTANTSVM
jgi:cytochrome P450